MKELKAKNDEVAFLNAQSSDRDVVIQKGRGTAKSALHLVSQHRDVVVFDRT